MDNKGVTPTCPVFSCCAACSTGAGFPIQSNRPAHTGLYDQHQAAENLWAHRKPFCSPNKHILDDFCHSAEGNMLVSIFHAVGKNRARGAHVGRLEGSELKGIHPQFFLKGVLPYRIVLSGPGHPSNALDSG